MFGRLGDILEDLGFVAQVLGLQAQSAGYMVKETVAVNAKLGACETVYHTAAVTEKVKEEGAFLWASDLFKSFSDLDTSSISGKKLSPTTYRITDSNTKNLLCQIAGFDIYELMFYLDTVTLTILDSNTLSCKFEINLTGNYGKVIITLSDYGTTII